LKGIRLAQGSLRCCDSGHYKFDSDGMNWSSFGLWPVRLDRGNWRVPRNHVSVDHAARKKTPDRRGQPGACSFTLPIWGNPIGRFSTIFANGGFPPRHPSGRLNHGSKRRSEHRFAMFVADKNHRLAVAVAIPGSLRIMASSAMRLSARRSRRQSSRLIFCITIAYA
jgi:hypothetical protein